MKVLNSKATQFGRMSVVCVVLFVASIGEIVSAASVTPEQQKLALQQFVGAASGRVAANYKLLSGSTAKLELLGRNVSSYKILESGSNRIYEISLDESGRIVDGETLYQQEQTAHEKKYGKLSPELFNPPRQASRMSSASLPTSSDSMIDVQIWLKEPKSEPSVAAHPVADNNGAMKGFSSTAIAEQTKAIERLQTASDEARAARLLPVTNVVIKKLAVITPQYSVATYAPAISAKVPLSALSTIASWAEVDQIYRDSGGGVPELSEVRTLTHANEVENLHFTGKGVKVAVVEAGAGRFPTNNPYLKGVTFDAKKTCSASSASHMTAVTGIIHSTHPTYRGIAPEASVWLGGSCSGTDADHQDRANAAVKWGAQVINLSWRDSTPSMGHLSANDRFFDDLVINRAILVVKSAGNSGTSDIDSYVTSPGLAYNVITVGGSEKDKNFTLMDMSSEGNPISANGDREKPEVIAPGANVISTMEVEPWISNGAASGTSFAAPVVTATAAVIIEAAPILGVWPEATKAIIMASSTAVTVVDSSHAAGVDILAAVNTARKLNGADWITVNYDCSSPKKLDYPATFIANKRTRVVISWSTDPAYKDYTKRPSADLDLIVIDPNGKAVSSQSKDNTYEVVDFTPTVSGTYTVRVNKTRCSLSPRRLGVAWYRMP